MNIPSVFCVSLLNIETKLSCMSSRVLGSSMNIPYQFGTYQRRDSIDTEPTPIDLLNVPVGVHPAGIEPADLPIMSWAL